ncbi:histidine kinase [Rhodoblastus sp. 17X3]|nr:histidine kinase [Rhodoblastus sp. 17X3]MDI9847861.1 histidine kinase [Rhodoblastus sp. 17X3]
MPSLFRFLLVLGLIAGAAFVGMAALVAFVEPQPREMSQPVPPSVLNK